MSDFYFNPDGSDELYHYGVPGMRWGHRKVYAAESNAYTKRANKWEARSNKSKTRLGKAFSEDREAYNRAKATTAKSMSKDNSIRNVISNTYGHKGLAATQEAQSKSFEKSAQRAKTKYGTEVNKAKAYNSKSWAESNRKIANSKNGKEYVKNLGNAIMNTPVKTWSGRQISSGQKMVEDMLGMSGIIDLRYSKINKDYGKK